MPRHSLFPNSVTIKYTTNGHPHKQVIPVGVVAGSSPGWTLPTKDGGTVDWRTAVEDYALLIAAIINDGDTIDSAELYTYEATSSPAEFLSAHTIAQPGLSAGAPAEWDQVVFPFKAIGGTFLRLTLLESVIPADGRDTFGGESNAGMCAIMEFILSDDSWLKTRGGDFPLISLGWVSKENDKLRKSFFLNV